MALLQILKRTPPAPCMYRIKSQFCCIFSKIFSSAHRLETHLNEYFAEYQHWHTLIQAELLMSIITLTSHQHPLPPTTITVGPLRSNIFHHQSVPACRPKESRPVCRQVRLGCLPKMSPHLPILTLPIFSSQEQTIVADKLVLHQMGEVQA